MLSDVLLGRLCPSRRSRSIPTRRHEGLRPASTQIEPVWVHGPDQLDLLLSPPSFKLFLTVDCLSGVVIGFPVEQPIDVVSTGKAISSMLLVLPDALFGMAGYADV